MNKKKNQLPLELVEQILMKLGFAEPPANDIEGLTSVYQAWCRKVPFDNILKRIQLHAGDPAPLPGHSEIDFFQSWLQYGVGGLCWAGNAALHSLLKTLGFSCTRGTVTMLIGTPTSPDHGTVAVLIEEQRFLVDASILHDNPLNLNDKQPSSIKHQAWGITCTPQNQTWVIDWRPLHLLDGISCRIENFNISRSSFQNFNEITRRTSPFNNSLYLRINTQQTVKGITDGLHIELDGSGRVVQTPVSNESKIKFLVEVAGISEEIVSQIPPDIHSDADEAVPRNS